MMSYKDEYIEYLISLQTKKMGYEMKGEPLPDELLEKLEENNLLEEDDDYYYEYLKGGKSDEQE